MSSLVFDPITIEAKQPNGKWYVRSALIHQNAEVMSGSKSREWLIRLATMRMFEWNGFDDKPMRITGIPRYNGNTGGSDVNS